MEGSHCDFSCWICEYTSIRRSNPHDGVPVCQHATLLTHWFHVPTRKNKFLHIKSQVGCGSKAHPSCSHPMTRRVSWHLLPPLLGRWLDRNWDPDIERIDGQKLNPTVLLRNRNNILSEMQTWTYGCSDIFMIHEHSYWSCTYLQLWPLSTALAVSPMMCKYVNKHLNI